MATVKPSTARKSAAMSKARSKATATSTVAAKSTEKSIEYTFENGLKISGTIDQIETVASSMGLKLNYKSIGHRPVGMYPSATKGLVRISTMNDYHLRRALLKHAKDYYAEVFQATDSNKQFLTKFTGLADDSLVVDLFTELSKR